MLISFSFNLSFLLRHLFYLRWRSYFYFLLHCLERITHNLSSFLRKEFVLGRGHGVFILLFPKIFLKVEIKSGHDIKYIIFNRRTHLIVIKGRIVNESVFNNSKSSENKYSLREILQPNRFRGFR